MPEACQRGFRPRRDRGRADCSCNGKLLASGLGRRDHPEGTDEGAAEVRPAKLKRPDSHSVGGAQSCALSPTGVASRDFEKRFDLTFVRSAEDMPFARPCDPTSLLDDYGTRFKRDKMFIATAHAKFITCLKRLSAMNEATTYFGGKYIVFRFHPASKDARVDGAGPANVGRRIRR